MVAKLFWKNGANYLAKVCAEYHENSGEIEIEKIENNIQIDNSVQEWIEEIEKNVNANKRINRANRVLTEENHFAQGAIIKDLPEVEQINKLLKLAEPTALIYR